MSSADFKNVTLVDISGNYMIGNDYKKPKSFCEEVWQKTFRTTKHFYFKVFIDF